MIIVSHCAWFQCTRKMTSMLHVHSKAVYKPVKYRLKVLPVTPYDNITTKFLHEIIDCSYDYPENIICSIN